MILWKLQFLWLKIFSNIACSLNSILKLNPNTLIESWIELNVNWIKFDSTIGSRLNSIEKIGMQIGGKFAHEYDVEKKTQKWDKSKKILFHASLLGNGLNIFQTKI